MSTRKCLKHHIIYKIRFCTAQDALSGSCDVLAQWAAGHPDLPQYTVTHKNAQMEVFGKLMERPISGVCAGRGTDKARQSQIGNLQPRRLSDMPPASYGDMRRLSHLRSCGVAHRFFSTGSLKLAVVPSVDKGAELIYGVATLPSGVDVARS
jgi:hypothetical protein